MLLIWGTGRDGEGGLCYAGNEEGEEAGARGGISIIAIDGEGEALLLGALPLRRLALGGF